MSTLAACLCALSLAAAPAPDTGTLRLDGGALFYEVAGTGPGVVLIHGGFGDRRMWDAQFAMLARRYRVVRYDHRGFGRSPAPVADYSPVADLARLLDHLGMQRAHLVGNSMGGTLALDFALRHPDRVERLVLLASGPSGYPATEEDKQRFAADGASVAAVFAAADSGGPERAVARWIAHPMVKVTSRDRRAGPLLRRMIRENAGIFRMRHWPFEPGDPPALARLGEVRAPTLVLIGERDMPLARASGEAAAGIPGARVVVVRGADHLPQMARPSEVNRLLLDFLRADVGRGAAQAYDLLVAGGTVVDGTGAPRFRADVAVRGDRIVRVSRAPLPRASARQTIDATGLVVAPGFVDLHAHLDPLLAMPDAESALRQGVTTALGGPDGGSPWPLAPYLDSAAALGVGINVAFLAGHNTIREIVMGRDDRAPTPAELERMRAMVARAMGEGAFGLSTGLRYLPGTFARTDEVVALARAAADSGGIYTSHLREEGLGLLEGVAEAMEIGRQARIPVVLTHHKAVGRKMWGASARTLAMVDSARRAGTDVMVDQYPYTATHTGLSVLIPTWALAGGDSAFARRVRDPALRDSVVRGIVFNILEDRGGGDLKRVQFSRVRWQPELEGRTLGDWAVMRGLPATPESGAELVIEAQLRGGANAIYHVLDEGDVERIMRHPQTMVASDGRLSRPGDGHPHPRAYGTFPRVLARYVRERGVLTLEAAVHKMTAQPAARLGLRDRGRIAEGAYADLVVLDPARVRDAATFDAPHRYPEGIPHVVVNGVPAVRDGRPAGVRAGRVLRRGR